MSTAFQSIDEMSRACDAASRLLEEGAFEEARAAFRAFWSKSGVGVKALRGLARGAMACGDNATAEGLWRTICEMLPADRWARHSLGVVLMNGDKLDEAKAIFSALVEVFPEFVAAWRGLAQAEGRRGDTVASLACFERAAVLEPENFANRRDCAATAIEASQWERAARHLDRLQQANADAPEFAVLRRALESGRLREATSYDLWAENDRGHRLREAGELHEAEAIFTTILERDPAFFHALRGMALIARARRDRPTERSFFRKAADAKPDDAWMRWELANLAQADGALEAARLGYLAILDLDRSFAPAYRGLAAMERAQLDEEAVGRILCEGLKRCPGNPWLTLDWALHLSRTGHVEDAGSLLGGLAEGDGPAATAAALELHYCLKAQGQDRAAREALTQALQRAPEDAPLRYAEAALRLADRDLAAAEQIYRELARRAGDRYWALIGLAQVMKSRGEDRQAASLLLDAIAVSPERAPAYGEMNEVLGLPEMRAEARERLREWAARRREDVEPRRLLLRYAGKEGDLDAAASIGAEILVRCPDDAPTMWEMMNISLRQGDGQGAVSWIDRAAASAPDQAVTLEMQALCADWRDDPERALQFYADALRRDPARHWIALARVKLLIALGRSEAGMAELGAFRAQRGETPDFFFTLVEMQRSVGDLDAATVVASSARAAFPRHARLQAQAALLDAELGRFVQAREGLAQAQPMNSHERAGLTFAAGMASLAQWRFDEAAALFAAAHEQRPEDGWILDRLIHAELLSFHLEGAGRHLRDLARLNRGVNHVKSVSASASQTHYGQLYDEFRLDRDACGQTRKALELQSQARLEALHRVVRAYPDYTAGAIVFLVALRQADAFLCEPRAADGRIPFAVTQFWDSSDLPCDLEEYSQSWSRLNPGFAYRRLNLTEARAFFEEIGRRDALHAFDRVAEPAMKADIFRLGWLSHYGGVYADCDDRCRSDLSPLLSDGVELVLYQEDLGSVGNNFIACAPRHPVICAAFDAAVRTVSGGQTEILWLATGPGLLTRALAAWLAEDDDLNARLRRIRVLDRHELLGFAAIHCVGAYKRTERHWSRTAFAAAPRRAAA